jgi:hypothetical protein
MIRKRLRLKRARETAKVLNAWQAEEAQRIEDTVRKERFALDVLEDTLEAWRLEMGQ